MSFDGEMSTRINPWGDGADIETAVMSMQTVKSAGLFFYNNAPRAPICSRGASAAHSFIFTGPIGNVPRLGLWSSMVNSYYPSSYNTANTSTVLSLTSHDGKDSHMGTCGNVGTCNEKTGICQCPEGWSDHSDTWSSCGKLVIPSSDWDGSLWFIFGYRRIANDDDVWCSQVCSTVLVWFGRMTSLK